MQSKVCGQLDLQLKDFVLNTGIERLQWSQEPVDAPLDTVGI